MAFQPTEQVFTGFIQEGIQVWYYPDPKDAWVAAQVSIVVSLPFKAVRPW